VRFPIPRADVSVMASGNDLCRKGGCDTLVFTLILLNNSLISTITVFSAVVEN
jgi:hypothetical protein